MLWIAYDKVRNKKNEKGNLWEEKCLTQTNVPFFFFTLLRMNICDAVSSAMLERAGSWGTEMKIASVTGEIHRAESGLSVSECMGDRWTRTCLSKSVTQRRSREGNVDVVPPVLFFFHATCSGGCGFMNDSSLLTLFIFYAFYFCVSFFPHSLAYFKFSHIIKGLVFFMEYHPPEF